MSGMTAPVECGVHYEWRFVAPLGLVGVPTLDGRVLGVPDAETAAQWVRKLPLPVVGYPRASRAGDGQGADGSRPVPVARVNEVYLQPTDRVEGGLELLATGAFGDTDLGRAYAGALALDAVALGIDLDNTDTEELGGADGEGTGVLVFTSWRITGVQINRDTAWDLRLLSRPHVWREKIST